MIELNQEPRGEAYNSLIDYALETCDTFMLVSCDYYRSGTFKREVKPILKELRPLLIKKRHNPCWPGTTVMSSNRYQYTILFYRCDRAAADLLKLPGHSFGWEYPHFPEDLAFFRRGQNWMATVAHEEMLWFNRETRQDRFFFRNLGVLDQSGISSNDADFYEPGIDWKQTEGSDGV